MNEIEVFLIIDKEVNWKIEWFKYVRGLPDSFWTHSSNRITFMDEFAIKYNIQVPSDWKRISVSLLKKQGGKVFLLLLFLLTTLASIS